MDTGANTLPAFSRDELLEFVRASQSWEQLLLHANTLLGPARIGFGDDPAAAQGAHLAWISCAFPIAAPPLAACCLPIKGKLFDHENTSIPRADLLAASFLAAKSIAIHLGCPLPNENALSQALAEANASAHSLAEALPSKTVFRQTPAHGFAPRGQNLLLRALVGPFSKLNAYEAPTLLEQAKYHAPFGNSPASPASPASTPADGSLLAAAEDARSRFGLNILNIGPVGGPSSALFLCLSVAEGMGSMSDTLGFADDSMIGLGGLDLSINSALDDLGGAYNPETFSVSISSECSSFGHEWTHALNHVAERMSWAAKGEARPLAKNANSGLKAYDSAIRHTAQDSAASSILTTAPLHWRDEQITDLAYEMDLATTDPFVLDTHERIMELAQTHPKRHGAIADAILPWIREMAGEDTAQTVRLDIFQDIVQVHCIEMQRQNAAASILAKGQSVFLCAAAVADRFNLYDTARTSNQGDQYWRSMFEMRARASEGFYADRCPHPFIRIPEPSIPGEAHTAIPHGSERSFLSNAYADWVTACTPLISAIRLHSKPTLTTSPEEALDKLSAKIKLRALLNNPTPSTSSLRS